MSEKIPLVFAKTKTICPHCQGKSYVKLTSHSTGGKCHKCGVFDKPGNSSPFTFKDVPPTPNEQTNIPVERREHIYHTVDGEPLLKVKVLKFSNGDKSCPQFRWNGKEWKPGGLASKDLTLYDAPILKLLQAAPQAEKDRTTVYIVEGEKDCEALKTAGKIATCNPMGAGKWMPHYNELLRGLNVVILPDNDKPGREHGAKVFQTLQRIAASVKIVNLWELMPDLMEKGDVSDFIAAGGNIADVIAKAAIKHGILTPITPEQKESERETYLSQNGRTQHKTGGRTQHKTVNRETGEIIDDEIPFRFWYEVEKVVQGKTKYSLRIEYVGLYRYLESIGIKILELDDKLKRVLVRVIDNVVSEIDLTGIKNIVIQYIKSLPWQISDNFNKDNLREIFTQGINQYLNDGAMVNVGVLTIEFLTDSSDRAFFFFKNGFIEVSKDTIERKPYSQLIGYIWESQIIDHNIEVIPDNDIQKITDFPFYQFIQNICSVKEPRTLDVSRWNSLQCIIGYLLHNYKTTANKRAVIFTEENIDDEKSNGGTGKGLIMQSIGKLRKVVTIDGPAFNFDSPFAYQNVTLDTQTLFLDDVPKHFPFPRLFSAITEGLSFEGKNKPRIHLPPEKSPKIVISTNFAIKGNSESDKRRKYEMELLSYYNSKFMPVHEFGSMFFQSWNAEQWNTFYNYMMTCVQIYFENDATIPEYSSATIKERKLLISTSADFVEFAKTLKTDTPLWIDETYMSFLNFAGFSEKDKNIPTKIQLGKWIKIYCDYKKLKFGRIKYDKKDGKLTRCHYIES